MPSVDLFESGGASFRTRVRPGIPLRALVVVVTATLLLTTALTGGASAHGSTYDPPSRNFGCWLRWGNDFQNPRMATEDPMCWQAWRADSTAMWNWSSLYREGVAGNHRRPSRTANCAAPGAP